MGFTRFGLVSILGSLTAFALFTSCAPDAAFTANEGTSQLDIDGHPDLPSMMDGDGNPGSNDGSTPNTNPSPKPSSAPTNTPNVPNVVPSTTPSTTPTTMPSTTPTAAPSTTPTWDPPGKGKPNPKPSVNPGHGAKDIPPSVVDALVEKYGCVDPADKNSREKKIQICHIPPGNAAAAHAICIAVPGAVNGHGIDVKTCKSPVGDYCGACR